MIVVFLMNATIYIPDGCSLMFNALLLGFHGLIIMIVSLSLLRR